MTLGVHAIVGAGVAALIPTHPVLGICAAFASHFAADAVPHRDYTIRSPSLHPDYGTAVQFNKALLIDLSIVGTDVAFGIVVSVLLFSTQQTPWYIVLAAFAGMLPDLIHVIEPRFKKFKPLVAFQKFHRWIQTEPKFLVPRPFLGALLQAAFLVAVVAAVKIYLAG
jgi:hypothetical protein